MEKRDFYRKETARRTSGEGRVLQPRTSRCRARGPSCGLSHRSAQHGWSSAHTDTTVAPPASPQQSARPNTITTVRVVWTALTRGPAPALARRGLSTQLLLDMRSPRSDTDRSYRKQAVRAERESRQIPARRRGTGDSCPGFDPGFQPRASQSDHGKPGSHSEVLAGTLPEATCGDRARARVAER